MKGLGGSWPAGGEAQKERAGSQKVGVPASYYGWAKFGAARESVPRGVPSSSCLSSPVSFQAVLVF